MKQEIMMWAVINKVTQKLTTINYMEPSLHMTRSDARDWMAYQKASGHPAARVRRVKVTVETVE
jgi:hypothetical protein